MAGRKSMVDVVVQGVDGLTRKDAEAAVDCVFDCIGELLVSGERVQVPGFGTFSLAERAARQGVNPSTGARIEIPASKSVRFKPGKDLKDRVNS
jgi:DNA-binding protein HU-beta